VGADHPAFGFFGKWYTQTGTPIRAILIQCVLALILIVVLGSFVKTILYTSPAVYLFYLATSVAVIVLRWREPHVERPYRVTGYPVTTLLFAAVCGYLIFSCVHYAIYRLGEPWIVFVPFAIMLCGIPLYLWSNWLVKRRARRTTK
jgi:amino acid transporter